MELLRASDHSLLVRFGEEISPELQERVWRLAEALRGAPVRNLHPGYGSLLISFDPVRITHDEVEALVRNEQNEPKPAPHRLIEIPVCYCDDFGPDLADVARHHGLAPAEVIERHSSAEYLVYFLGFSPGFAYLGGLPESLATPRLATPRPRVAAGSVGIGGRQTGVYPAAGPGGWRIIGRTALRLFDPAGEPPALLRMGDRVRFVPVSREEYELDSGR